MFSALEPTAGMALAINLAYLNLPVFRYRMKIKAAANAELSTLRADHSVDAARVGHLDQLNDMRFLAEEEGTQRPRGITMWWYARILASRFDVYISVALGMYAGLLVFIGAAHNLLIWDIIPRQLPTAAAGIIFYLLILAVVLPPAFIMLGRTAIVWAERRAKHCAEQIAAIFVGKAEAAAVPNLEEFREKLAETVDQVYGRLRKGPPPPPQ
jgi:hypothetical protein